MLLNPSVARPKLDLVTLNGSVIYGTHDVKMVERWKRNGKMAQNPPDSGRKDGLITGRQIQMNIYDRKNEVRGKIYSEMLKKR